MRGDGKGQPNSNCNHFYYLLGEDNSFLMEWVKRNRNNYIRHARRDVESHGTEEILGDCCGSA